MLTDFLIEHGFHFFASGWTQFAVAFAVSFMIMIVFGRGFIRLMRKIQGNGQPISENVPLEHRKKAGTPSMGGVLMLVAIFVASLLFMPINSMIAWIALSSLLMFGLIGFADDYKKISSQSKKSSNGLSPSLRLALEAVCVIILAYLINRTMPGYVPKYSIVLGSSMELPLATWNLGYLFGIPISGAFIYYIFAYFVICGSANATNITDGLDGMLAKLYIPVLIVLAIALYGATRTGFMDAVIFLPETVALYSVLGAVFGAVLGFLWFNAKPAAIFMGDVGSLALGGFMGTIAMLLKSEIIMGVAAGMMVLILLSSFIQTMYFKFTRKISGTGKRIFLRAPLHHHFEELGWPETKIVDRFFVLSILFAGCALILLKFV
ncbi:MAG: phospho-N-acetylmuramoyl-pentapeptide-transferase [Alphaproteobacteria bacterium]|nr:phospho-N-acetylmuramoyl-pentapeptide-transferase [Alphaproteobacteria bacterium]MBQ6012305.1 phospho-N-acetylmuramoyl-pentapeptide-transferase [Alphaproteobacteria bacterium]